jgi:pimeloyl-ACP methyl ester carboxylesterase
MFNHQSGQYLEVDSAKIYYEIAGAKNKPVLLVLHGGIGTLEDMNILLPALAKRFMLLGVDSRGHGKSTMGAHRLTYERIQKDVEQVLQHLKIDTLSILGFSDGGIVAYRLASFTKFNISRIVTIGAYWHYNNANAMRNLFKSITPNSWKERLPETYTTYQKLNSEPDFNHLLDASVKMWLDPGASGYPSYNLQRYTNPLLIIRGDDDHLLSRQMVVEQADLMPNASLLNVPFAGHDAFTAQKEVVSLCLDRFLVKH